MALVHAEHIRPLVRWLITEVSKEKGDSMKFIRIMIVGFFMSVVAIAATTTPSSAWSQKVYFISSAAAPFTLVLNEDQFQGKWKQFKGDLKKKWGNFTDDDLLYIEGRRDKLEGKIQERYGDRRDEVKKWVDDWFEQNKTSQNMKP